MTLTKPYELCPEEEAEDGELTDEQDSSPQPEDSVPGYSQSPSSSSQNGQPRNSGGGGGGGGSSSGGSGGGSGQVQNNQVSMPATHQPVQPTNQINNQLNQAEPKSRLELLQPQNSPPLDTDTCEEESSNKGTNSD
ncbi:homeotic protein ultrabithorax-like [Liolophura sinensis]|uniref:homeotic protein ultrabithorax-like n=1 Tax=Liolophura sinensis TaxID=3198878 RepID=UPI00315881A8